MVSLVFAGPCFPQSPDGALDQALASLSEDTGHGAQSADLIAPLTALALRQREQGSYALAAATIDRALDIVRINYGLYSLEQVPLIRQSIDNEQARGDYAAAWNREQELVDLIRRHPDGLSTVTVFRELAEKRLATIDDYIAGEYPPEIVLGCFYRSLDAAFGSCTSGGKGRAVWHMFDEASRYYDDAIEVLLRHGLYASNELRELEMAMIRANYLYGSELYSPNVSEEGRYGQGRRRLQQLAEHAAKGSNALAEIDALFQIGDWELLYANNSRALAAYAHAYERLQQEELPQESIDEFLAPAMPIVLPAYFPNPFASEATSPSTGFIDVQFEITRYGRSRQIEVIDTTSSTAEDIDELLEMISRSRFRPRIRDGRVDEASRVALRYYVGD